MSRRSAKASGWRDVTPRVVGERSVLDDYYNSRPARTSVPRRRNFRVPDGGPWPCEGCGEFLTAGEWAHRRIRNDEPFYRHRTCQVVA